jgi:hypothetical protein
MQAASDVGRSTSSPSVLEDGDVEEAVAAPGDA